jgi:hypothetical protein
MDRANLRARAREGIPFTFFPDGGLPRAALTEISGAHGSGKTALVLRFLAENPALRTAWVEDRLTAFPTAFPLQGVGLERVLFADAGKEVLWTALQALRSQLFEVVVVSGAFSVIELRRLQLGAEQAHATVLLLAEEPTREGTWPILLQLEVRGRPAAVRVLKSPNRSRVWNDVRIA